MEQSPRDLTGESIGAPIRMIEAQLVPNEIAGHSSHTSSHSQLFLRRLAAHDFRHLVIHDFISLWIKPHISSHASTTIIRPGLNNAKYPPTCNCPCNA